MTPFALTLKIKEVIVNLYVNMLTNTSSSFLHDWRRQLKFVNFRYHTTNYIITKVTKRIQLENLLQLEIVTSVTATLMHITGNILLLLHRNA